jgi:hypothetical protein
MESVQVRPFHRRDRQQLTDLVNAHAAAVVPGLGVSVRESGCRGTGDGPTSAIFTSPSSTTAAESRPRCWDRRPTGSGWHKSSASWTTRGWKAKIPPARTTPATGRAWPHPASANSPAPSADGRGPCTSNDDRPRLTRLAAARHPCLDRGHA